MVFVSLMLFVVCIVIYYVISEFFIIIYNKLEFFLLEVSGWQRVNIDEEIKYNIILCMIERRVVVSLNFEEFERVYRYKKLLIVYFRNGVVDWIDFMKWMKLSLLSLYSQWFILSGILEDIVWRGGNGDI